jgi:hypothetical protein
LRAGPKAPVRFDEIREALRAGVVMVMAWSQGLPDGGCHLR